MTDAPPAGAPGTTRAATAQRPTIYSIASDLGVSASSVSRAFSRPELIGAVLRDRILAHADEVGYRPSQAARGLVTGRTGLIGVVVRDLENPFCPPLVRAVQQAAADRGLSLVLADVGAGLPEVEQIQALARNVDALILVGSRLPERDLRQLTHTVRVLLVNRADAALPHVCVDPGPALRRAGELLRADGHVRFGLQTGPSRSWAARSRADVVRSWAGECGVSLTELRSDVDDRDIAAPAAADQIVAEGLTAVFAFDDLQACGMLAGLHARGVRVPDDVSLVGFDDVLLARTVSPALTTVSTPFADLGRVAVEHLLDGHSPQQTLLPGTLTVRDSTGPAPGEHR